MEPGGAPEPSSGPLGAAGRVCAFGRQPAASHSTRGPGRAGPAAASEGDAGPEACQHHAGSTATPRTA
eukprot:5582595-Alexandrium_andersonii.AAC.1